MGPRPPVKPVLLCHPSPHSPPASQAPPALTVSGDCHPPPRPGLHLPLTHAPPASATPDCRSAHPAPQPTRGVTCTSPRRPGLSWKPSSPSLQNDRFILCSRLKPGPHLISPHRSLRKQSHWRAVPQLQPSVHQVSSSPAAFRQFWKEARLLYVAGTPHLERCPFAVPFLSCSFSNAPSLASRPKLSPPVLPLTAPGRPYLPSHTRRTASGHWLTFPPSPHYPVTGRWPCVSCPPALCLRHLASCPAHTGQPRIFADYPQAVAKIKGAVCE